MDVAIDATASYKPKVGRPRAVPNLTTVLLPDHLRFCSVCYLTMPDQAFDRAKTRKSAPCKACRSAKRKAQRPTSAQRESHLKASRAYYARNVDSIRIKKRDSARESWHVSPNSYSDPEFKRRHQNYTLKSVYGLDTEQLDTLFASQNHCCGICSKPLQPWDPGKRRQFHIDHDHETRAVRGVLCSTCNTGLGCMGDNAEGLNRALRYLERTQKSNV